MAVRVLLIEDDDASLALMTYLLKAFGHSPVGAHTGEEGLMLAVQAHPDLIVCDLRLPGLDGFAIAQALKARADLRPIPLLAVTAFAMVGDREHILASGFDGYLSKPIAPESFVHYIESMLRRNGPVPIRTAAGPEVRLHGPRCG